MRTTIRDIIVNACDESRLVNRNQPVPANIFVSAYTLLQKRLNQYSNTNLLSFVRKEIDIKPKTESTLIGERSLKDDYIEDVNFWIADTIDDLPTANANIWQYIPHGQALVNDEILYVERYKNTPSTFAYRWSKLCDSKDWDGWYSLPDIEVNNIQNVVKCYKKYSNEWVELRFVSYEDFYRYPNNSEVYTILPIADDSLRLIVKTSDIGKELKLMYNEHFDFNEDSELRIPQQYVSLFTAGLVYDLALQYPRLSDNTVALLKNRLDELEANVRTSSSVNKFIARPVTRESLTYDSFVSGRFLNL